MSSPPRRMQVERNSEESNRQLRISRPTVERRQRDCRYCKKDHPLRKCQRFRGLSAIKRLSIARKFRYCINCLAHSHQLRDCRSSERCKVCFVKHHTLLHDSSAGQARNKKSKRRSRKASKANQMTTTHGNVSTPRAATIIINVNSTP